VTFLVFQVKLPPVTTSLYSHSKVEAIPLSAFPKDTTSELAVLSSYFFYAEHQAGKLWISA